MNSLPDIFTYGQNQTAIDRQTSNYAVPEELPYFADLDRLGYRTSAVLPNYFDLCVKQKLTHCRKFETSELTSMLGSRISVFDRAKVFGFTLLNLTDFPSRLTAAVQGSINNALRVSGRRVGQRQKLTPLTSIREFDRFILELSNLSPGEARVAHILMPHEPFMLDAGCKVKPEDQWLDDSGPASVAKRENAYIDQVRCLQGRIGKLVDALAQTQAGRNAIVLLHGDHGSRIAPSQPFVNAPVLSDREMVMSYSALFAIRMPREPAAEIAGTYALDDLMADFRARNFSSAPRLASSPARVWVQGVSPLIAPEWRSLPEFSR